MPLDGAIDFEDQHQPRHHAGVTQISDSFKHLYNPAGPWRRASVIPPFGLDVCIVAISFLGQRRAFADMLFQFQLYVDEFSGLTTYICRAVGKELVNKHVSQTKIITQCPDMTEPGSVYLKSQGAAMS